MALTEQRPIRMDPDMRAAVDKVLKPYDGETLDQVKRDVTSILARAQLRSEEDIEALEARNKNERMNFQHAEAKSAIDAADAQPASAAVDARQAEPFVREDRKVGRNEPCPCGSGKKYKRCHGQLG